MKRCGGESEPKDIDGVAARIPSLLIVGSRVKGFFLWTFSFSREVKRRSDENRSRERSRDISLSTAPPPTIAPSPQRVALSGTIPVPPSIPPLLPPSLFQTPPPPPRMVPPIFGSPPLSVPCLTQPTLLRPGEVPRPVGLPQPIIISPMVRLTITEEPSKVSLKVSSVKSVLRIDQLDVLLEHRIVAIIHCVSRK